jgi:hypothetical protein
MLVLRVRSWAAVWEQVVVVVVLVVQLLRRMAAPGEREVFMEREVEAAQAAETY